MHFLQTLGANGDILSMFQTKFLDERPDDSPMHPSFSHDDMNKMFESPRKFSLADLISNSEVVEAASVERKPSKPSLSEYYHVDESDYSSTYSFRCKCRRRKIQVDTVEVLYLDLEHLKQSKPNSKKKNKKKKEERVLLPSSRACWVHQPPTPIPLPIKSIGCISPPPCHPPSAYCPHPSWIRFLVQHAKMYSCMYSCGINR